MRKFNMPPMLVYKAAKPLQATYTWDVRAIAFTLHPLLPLLHVSAAAPPRVTRQPRACAGASAWCSSALPAADSSVLAVSSRSPAQRKLHRAFRPFTACSYTDVPVPSTSRSWRRCHDATPATAAAPAAAATSIMVIFACPSRRMWLRYEFCRKCSSFVRDKREQQQFLTVASVQSFRTSFPSFVVMYAWMSSSTLAGWERRKASTSRARVGRGVHKRHLLQGICYLLAACASITHTARLLPPKTRQNKMRRACGKG